MRASLPAALAHIRAVEGGYVLHPDDPGGCTKYGITLDTYRRYVRPVASCRDIQALTWAEAADIYRDHYWVEVRGDDLPAGLDLVVFDAAVNSGSERAIRWLQEVLGVKVDGILGPITLRAALMADVPATILAYQDRRLTYLRSLRTWRVFGRGWTARLQTVERHAMALARTTRPSPTSPATTGDP